MSRASFWQPVYELNWIANIFKMGNDDEQTGCFTKCSSDQKFSSACWPKLEEGVWRSLHSLDQSKEGRIAFNSKNNTDFAILAWRTVIKSLIKCFLCPKEIISLSIWKMSKSNCNKADIKIFSFSSLLRIFCRTSTWLKERMKKKKITLWLHEQHWFEFKFLFFVLLSTCLKHKPEVN